MFNRYFDTTKEGSEDFVYANMCLRNIYFALISLEYILDKPNIDYATYHDQNTYYFFHIQSLLTACGNISNVFYNRSGNIYRRGEQSYSTTERCKRLRKLFNIRKADFPIVFQKEARNTNEHSDERYQAFDCVVGDYNIIDENTDDYMRDIIISNPHLRTFDKQNMSYLTYDNQKRRIVYNLVDLRLELLNMFDIINSNPITNVAWADN